MRQKRIPIHIAACVLLAGFLSDTGEGRGAPPPRIPVLLDTDIGTGIEDAFALGLALGSHELDVRGVTAVGGETRKRAMLLCRFLTMTGRRHIRVAAGDGKQPARAILDQEKYHYHPDPIFNRTTKPDDKPATDFLHERLKAQPGKVTLVALGPLTNVAALLEKHADARTLLHRIVLLEANVKLDPEAGKKVLASGVPLVVLGEKACAGLTLDDAEVKQVFSPGTPLTRNVETLYQMWDHSNPPLTDALAVALCFAEQFASFERNETTRFVTSVKRQEFAKWYAERMASLVAPERQPSKLIEQGGMPLRVHVAEDFDNDIERFWWMSGKAESKLLPPGSKRACRAVLTHDFDDLLMVSRQMYKAVIFNPVPGPPMGKNTRLSFRYWLKGTDTLRVQIYSLTNGYHRHLVLKQLPQEKWQNATVDMTAARRPDGTGGPLSEDERIDDIQFYIDPQAELIIDDIFLFDAAPPGEKRPFPARVHFSGLFDSGRQGKEWPGDFEIVPHKPPLTWKAARSVLQMDTGTPWIRLHLRGERPLGETTHLRFRYHLTGGNAMRVVLLNRSARDTHTLELKSLQKGTWAEATLDFGRALRERGQGGPARGDRTDEVRFLLPKGAELLLDDVLLYEPGSPAGK